MRNIRTAPQLLVRLFVRPFFPFFQWLVLSLGIVKAPDVRQPYSFGYLREGISTSDAKEHLRTQGFFMNRIAFNDPGQVLSMRRLCDKKPDWQYHIRIFEDGEICAHYELTPEDHPFAHLKAEGQVSGEKEIKEWIKDIT